MAGAYTLGRDVYADYAASRDREDRGGPVGAGPTVGATTPRGRAEEAAFGSSRVGAGTASSGIPYGWIVGAGIVVLLLVTTRKG
jgi:hypothetical protein